MTPTACDGTLGWRSTHTGPSGSLQGRYLLSVVPISITATGCAPFAPSLQQPPCTIPKGSLLAGSVYGDTHDTLLQGPASPLCTSGCRCHSPLDIVWDLHWTWAGYWDCTCLPMHSIPR